MKVRIFALAKELGMDSKELFEHAAEAGVKVKNNALASVSEAERDVILAHISGEGGAGSNGKAAKKAAKKAPEPPKPAAAAPVRPQRPVETKIRTVGGPAKNERRTDVADHPEPEPEPEPVAVEEAAPELELESAPQVEAEAQPAEPAAEEPSAKSQDPQRPQTRAERIAAMRPVRPVSGGGRSVRTLGAGGPAKPAAKPAGAAPTPPPVAKPAAPPAPSTSAKPAPAAQPAQRPDKPLPAAVAESARPAAEAPAAKPAPASPATPPATKASADEPANSAAPQRPVKAAGSLRDRMRAGGPREMTAIGVVQTTKKQREKKRPQIARPAVAAPPEPPSPVRPGSKGKGKAPDEPKAQKPDVKLTAAMMGGESPLSQHVRGIATGQRKSALSRGVAGKADAKSLLEQRRIEQLKRVEDQRRRRRPRPGGGFPPGMRRRGRSRSKGPVEYGNEAVVEAPITVRSLSEGMGRPANSILQVLFKAGRMATMNDSLTEEEALEIALELGVELEIKSGRDLEAELEELLEIDEDEAGLALRPPVVTILGHVDHGKTTMVDRLRSGNTAAGEAGGITQHIAAYQVMHNGKAVTFVDTPGHAAFGEMRARGANVTDLVILVVAADDGVMPQTEEAISHAKAAEVPMIVALNKIDLPGVDEQKTLQGLAQQNVLPAEWGGDVEVVRTSGETGQGLDELLETIQLTAELNEYKANPDRDAVGTCLEAFRNEGRGPVSWFIVQNGTLKVGDVVLCGSAYGKVRAMYDDRDNPIKKAGPSMPVKVSGLDEVPAAGAHFFVLKSLEDARELAEQRKFAGRSEELASMNQRPQTFDEIMAAARGEAETTDLPLILKADTPGSLQALKAELLNLDNPEVRVRLKHSGVGPVNESDVRLADTAAAVIIAFHTETDPRAEQLADQEGVEIRDYQIIYEVIDDIRSELEGLLKPEQREIPTGRALVLATFKTSKFGTIAGCRVLGGTIARDHRCRVVRDQEIIGDYDIASLRREKDDVKEIREGFECGIRLKRFNDVREGDLLEAYRVEEVKRTLEQAEAEAKAAEQARELAALEAEALGEDAPENPDAPKPVVRQFRGRRGR
ncbi:translation initiation factor IF-2 [Alienimonas californiensis]|uniref:Translation initiation factor IF-2 n=1 Tax=Alienimonas californiensis TaxID=2527989 RepID=A0A517PF25_9PLAN|nr:translation initiation factor IF-2 [Alienimonas californiensis]QDT17962.1 Translation initiation factor IF-2 [Alienimonas californiensis]